MQAFSSRKNRLHRPSLLAAAGGLLATAASAAYLATSKRARRRVEKNIETFDDLDFNVFSNQQWDELHKSHSDDIVVHWPDGHETKGLKQHVEDLKAMFVFAPDTRIKEHPVKFGNGEWTTVTGWMEGTFTNPMPLPDGKTIAPTGKSYRVPMATIGHWNKDGVMDEEYLYWDNQTFLDQLGLGKQ